MKKSLKRIASMMMAVALVVTSMSFGSATVASAATTSVTLTAYEGWLESASVEWTPITGATGYNVYVKGASEDDSAYVQLDDELIRQYKTYLRADALGLKAGNYIMKVVPIIGGSVDASKQAISPLIAVEAHDRTGFAWVNGTSSGAYNEDGTLKSNAIVIYVTEKTKNTVTAQIITDGKGTLTTGTGVQGIMDLIKKAYETRPVDFRFVGEITDLAYMENGDLVIENNNRPEPGVTIEGVGNDATANGWGLRIKNASNVEVRNLAFMNCDSGEGDNVGLQQNDDHIWVHNCDMYYGNAGSDADQIKGDGALDTKKSTYVTMSYNHFFDNGKCNLLGLSESTVEGLYITYHHNWYDHSDSRHPRIRFYTAHVYNNCYDGNAKYGIGATTGSSVFSENNYFRNCKYPMLISMQGSDVYNPSSGNKDYANYGTFSSESGGIIKAYGNVIIGAKRFIPYGDTSVADSTTEFDAVVVENKTDKISSDIKTNLTTTATLADKWPGGNSYNNFDTSPSMYSYTADTAEVAKEKVEKYAGRTGGKGGDMPWTFNNSVDDESYEVNAELKAAIVAYKTKLVSVGGGSIVEIIPLTGISLNKTSDTLERGDTLQLNVTYAPANTSDSKAIVWSSSDFSVATVSNSGLVSAVAAGETTITATSTVDSSITATCTITVVKGDGSLKSLSIGSDIAMVIGGEKTLDVVYNPSDTTQKGVTWSSDNTLVATVDANGKVTGVGEGSATITATSSVNSAIYASITASVSEVNTSEYAHNFTESGKTSSFYAITGTLSTSKGTVIYNGLTLTQCLKMESSTNVTFTAPTDGKLTMVFVEAAPTYKLNGVAATGTSNVVEVDIKAGLHIISKRNTANLYYLDFTPASTPTPTPPTAEELVRSFVERMYTVVLGRDAEADGLNFWTNALITGSYQGQAVTGSVVAKQFIEGAEFVAKNLSDEDFMTIMYKAIMDRDADETGMQTWLEVLGNGVSRTFVLNGFMGSPEFTTICETYGIEKGSIALEESRDKNYQVTCFAQRCYSKVLGRKADVEGLNTWCEAIITKQATPKQVAHGFIFSAEVEAMNLTNEEFSTVLYRTLMGREPESTSVLAGWADYISVHGKEDAFNLFADGAEFAAIVAGYGL